MKVSELKNKTVTDLEKMSIEKRAALRAFRFGVSGSKIKNIKEGRDLRREIARIETILKDKKSESLKVTN